MSLNPLVDSRDVRFVLFEMLGLDKISRFEHFAGLDRDVFEDTLSLAEKIAMAHFYSTNAEADKVGLTYDPKTAEVHVPDFLRPGYNAFIEAGFHNLKLPVEEGAWACPLPFLSLHRNISMLAIPRWACSAAHLPAHSEF
jgi:Acyl-CoA dehydrogenase N terminal